MRCTFFAIGHQRQWIAIYSIFVAMGDNCVNCEMSNSMTLLPKKNIQESSSVRKRKMVQYSSLKKLSQGIFIIYTVVIHSLQGLDKVFIHASQSYESTLLCSGQTDVTFIFSMETAPVRRMRIKNKNLNSHNKNKCNDRRNEVAKKEPVKFFKAVSSVICSPKVHQ